MKEKSKKRISFPDFIKNKRGMEMVQVAILVAIAVTLGLIFRTQIKEFVEGTFNALNNAKF